MVCISTRAIIKLNLLLWKILSVIEYENGFEKENRIICDKKSINFGALISFSNPSVPLKGKFKKYSEILRKKILDTEKRLFNEILRDTTFFYIFELFIEKMFN